MGWHGLAASYAWAPRNCAGNVRMGITMLHQGTDKDHVALGAVASRSLTNVPEVFWGVTSALLQQRTLPWLGMQAARWGAGSGAVLLSIRVRPDQPMAPAQKPWLARQAGRQLGGGSRCLLLPRDGKRGEQA